MNENLIPQVNSYLSSVDTTPLDFYCFKLKSGKAYEYEYTVKHVSDMSVKTLGLERVILNTLEHTNNYASGVNGNIETGCDCYRSSLDIWRHIKRYNPDVTIFDVMRCIGNHSYTMELYSHICSSIERRVFRIADGDDWENEINDSYDRDEYELTFDEWSEL